MSINCLKQVKFLLSILFISHLVGCVTNANDKVYKIENGKMHIDKKYVDNFQPLAVDIFMRDELSCGDEKINGRTLIDKLFPYISAGVPSSVGGTQMEYLIPEPTFIKEKKINNKLYIKLIYQTVKDPGNLIEGGVEAVVDVCAQKVLFAVNFSPF